MSDSFVRGETAGPSHAIGHESGGTSNADQLGELARQLDEMKWHPKVAKGERNSCKALAGLRAGVVLAPQLTSPRHRGLLLPRWGLRWGARLPPLPLVGLPPFLPRSPSQLAPPVLLKEAGRAGRAVGRLAGWDGGWLCWGCGVVRGGGKRLPGLDPPYPKSGLEGFLQVL